MKIFPFVFFIFLFFTSCALGANRYTWTAGDTIMQSAFIALVLVDWQQTREFTGNRNKYPGIYESNPLLRDHPSAREVNIAVGACTVVHTAVAFLLPKPYRTIWQSFWIGVEADAVRANYEAGIRLRF